MKPYRGPGAARHASLWGEASARGLPHTARMDTNRIAHVAALAGEPARTAMLLALMDGRALTARELAGAAHIRPAAASRHLALMVEAGLLQVQPQGRHRYHRLASAQVARMLEGLMQLAVLQPARCVATGPADAALRTARSCYDHLAGRLGVAIAGHLSDAGAVVLDADATSAQATERLPAALLPLGIPAESLALPGGQPPPAAPAWTGASGACTWRAGSAPWSAGIAWTAAGCSAAPARGRWPSPLPARWRCATGWAWRAGATWLRAERTQAGAGSACAHAAALAQAHWKL